MTVKETFSTAKDFCEFIKQNQYDFKDLYVKEIYNTGDAKYCETPLFLYSGYSVIMTHLSEGILSLNIYDKDFFIQHIRGGIFRENPDSEEFYHFNFTSSRLINDYVKDIDIKENDDGTIGKIDLTFKSGTHLYIKNSPLVKGTMLSFISE